MVGFCHSLDALYDFMYLSYIIAFVVPRNLYQTDCGKGISVPRRKNIGRLAVVQIFNK